MFVAIEYPIIAIDPDISCFDQQRRTACLRSWVRHWGGQVEQEVSNLSGLFVNNAEQEWKVTCLLFSPHAPEQNPVEDIWLRGKNFPRKHFYKNKAFRQVKSCFSDFINKQIFDINKIYWYLNIAQSV